MFPNSVLIIFISLIQRPLVYNHYVIHIERALKTVTTSDKSDKYIQRAGDALLKILILRPSQTRITSSLTEESSIN